MSSSKEIDLAADVYLSEFQNPHTPIQYNYSHKEVREGIEPERRVDGHQFKKLGRKYQHD
jgi:hypothetical protein